MIQQAVGAAQPGDTVLATNGVYQTGGTGDGRVALTNAVLQSVKGPGATVIDGGKIVRCACLGTNAVVSGFTLTNGSAGNGGGVSCEASGVVTNCVITSNYSTASGGGASGGTLYNCIVYFNSGGNYAGDCGFSYCCTTPMPASGVGNIDADPLFVDSAGGNLRLQAGSPCINAGNNAYVTTSTDLDGRPRIVGGKVDIGAYEFQPGTSGAFIAWLQKYGLPTNGSADYADTDGDGLNNWQEWRCGTNPTNAFSVLCLLPAVATGSNVTVSWQSVAGVSYFLERSADLAATPRFTPLATNLPGQPGTTAFTDTNAAVAPRRFYRVGVGN